jgi:hypothetical protein
MIVKVLGGWGRRNQIIIKTVVTRVIITKTRAAGLEAS